MENDCFCGAYLCIWNCRVYDACYISEEMFVQSVKFTQAHSSKRVNLLFTVRSRTQVLGLLAMPTMCGFGI